MTEYYIDHDKELRVLASCISFPEKALPVVSEILSPDDFNKPSNRSVYDVLSKMFPGKPIDIMTVKDELKKNHYKVSDDDLGLIMAFDPIGCDLEWTAKKVREISNRRRIYYFCASLAEKARKESDYEALETYLGSTSIKLFDSITIKTSQIVPIKDTVTKITELLGDCYRNKDGLNTASFVPTGFADFDKTWGGFLPKSLIYISGHTNSGKTLFTQQIARNMARRGPVLYISSEVIEFEFGKRIIGIDANVSVTELNRGPITEELVMKVAAASTELMEAPFYQVYTPVSINGILGLVNKVQGWHQCDLAALIIDRLEILDERHDKGEDDVRWTTRMSRKLVHLSKILNCPLLVVTQPSRFSIVKGSTHDHRPRSADLKNSSALEQDAQTVIIVHREEMFSSNKVFEGVTEIMVPKHMYGSQGGIFLTYRPDIPKFENFYGDFDDLQKQINDVRNPRRKKKPDNPDKQSSFAGRTSSSASPPDDGDYVNDNPF